MIIDIRPDTQPKSLPQPATRSLTGVVHSTLTQRNCFFNLLDISGSDLETEISSYLLSQGGGIWQCSVCGLGGKKGDIKRHVELTLA